MINLLTNLFRTHKKIKIKKLNASQNCKKKTFTYKYLKKDSASTVNPTVLTKGSRHHQLNLTSVTVSELYCRPSGRGLYL